MEVLQNNKDPTLIQIGVWVCLLSFTIPFQSNLSLLMLIIIGVWSAFSNKHIIAFGYRSALFIPVFLFLIGLCLTIFTSNNVYHSLRLSVPLIHATLIFYLINENFLTTRSIDGLYSVLSVLVFAVAVILLWIAWSNPEENPATWILNSNNALLVVPNDTVFFSILSPLSFYLAFFKQKTLTTYFSLTSIFLSIIVFIIYQSRIALLTMVVALSPMLTLLRLRLVIMWILALLISAGLIDAFMGWPLLDKFIRFGHKLDPRWALWLSAWSMFVDRPLLGFGLHTFGLFYQPYFQQISIAVDPRHTPWAHNLYLETLAEQGIVGMLALALLLFRVMTISWHLKTIASCQQHKISVLALFSSFLGFSCAALFDLTWKRLWVWIVFAILLGSVTVFSYLLTEAADVIDKKVGRGALVKGGTEKRNQLLKSTKKHRKKCAHRNREI
jgi:O-antigen ligase